MSELIHISIDTETLGVREGAVLLSIGAVAFKFSSIEQNEYQRLVSSGFYAKLDVQSQIKQHGRTVEQDTVNWWEKQDEKARRVLKPSVNDVSLLVALSRLNEWISNSGYDFKNSFVWARGSSFDFPKLESAYAQTNLAPAFNTWKIRDSKTFYDVLQGTNTGAPESRTMPEGFIKHNALHDAALDSWSMVELFKRSIS